MPVALDEGDGGMILIENGKATRAHCPGCGSNFRVTPEIEKRGYLPVCPRCLNAAEAARIAFMDTYPEARDRRLKRYRENAG